MQIAREKLRAALVAAKFERAKDAEDSRLKNQLGYALVKMEEDPEEPRFAELSEEHSSLLDRVATAAEDAGGFESLEIEIIDGEKPSKKPAAKPADDDDDDEPESPPAKKSAASSRVIDDGDDDDEPEAPAKKPVAKAAAADDDDEEPGTPAVPARRGRGRPRKAATEEEAPAKKPAAKPADEEAEPQAPAKKPEAKAATSQPASDHVAPDGGTGVLYGYRPGRNKAYLAGVVASRFGDKIASQGGIGEFEADVLAGLIGEDRDVTHYQALQMAMHIRRGIVQADAIVTEARYAKASGHHFSKDAKAAIKEILAAAK